MTLTVECAAKQQCHACAECHNLCSQCIFAKEVEGAVDLVVIIIIGGSKYWLMCECISTFSAYSSSYYFSLSVYYIFSSLHWYGEHRNCYSAPFYVGYECVHWLLNHSLIAWMEHTYSHARNRFLPRKFRSLFINFLILSLLSLSSSFYFCCHSNRTKVVKFVNFCWIFIDAQSSYMNRNRYGRTNGPNQAFQSNTIYNI